MSENRKYVNSQGTASNNEVKPKKKLGRPAKVDNIDKAIFENLCKIQCTQEEICAVLGVSTTTLEKWIKQTYEGKLFSQVFREKRGVGRASLRRSQFTAAEKGNSTMLVWLGKNYLGQSDTPRPAEDSTVEDDALSKSLKELGKEL